MQHALEPGSHGKAALKEVKVLHWRELRLIQFITSSTNSFVSQIDDQDSDINIEDS